MYSVKKMCDIAGVSARTLQYYDSIGILRPAAYTEAGYRLYDDGSLKRLEQIMILRELDFSLKEIGELLDDENYDREKAIMRQIKLLTLKKERLELIIGSMKRVQEKGELMDFKAFSDAKIQEYQKQAKDKWGDTEEFAEFEKKQAGRSSESEKDIADELMHIFTEFGEMKEMNPADEEVQNQVRKLQEFISHNYYECSDKVLASLGQMYAAGGEFTANIDKAGGAGTAVFAADAIKIFTA